MNLLPTTYLGSVDWYKRYFANPAAVMIEVMESFPKQTYRNRCTITTPDGPLLLSVPVKRADSKQLTRDVEISYQQRWQHQHWIALMSAYKRTPYFDYYTDYFRPFYEKETKYLVDLNARLHEVIVDLINNNASPFVKKDNIDNSCAAPTLRLAESNALRYTADWMGLDLESSFGDGQSVLDWLFEYGPESSLKFKV